jgi:hypothetical protein
MVIVTYDEYGGAWDHEPPPGQGGTPGPHDQWGPGPRIPAIIVSPLLPHAFAVDHTQYDTTSVMATFEKRFGLAPVATRDAQVNDLSDVFDAEPGPGPDPSRFRLGSLRRNLRKGTGKLPAYVPGAGRVILRGRLVVPRRPSGARSSAKTVSGAGRIRLNIKAKGKARRRLNRRGRAKVRIIATFDPNTGPTQKLTKKLVLRKRR